MYCKTCIHDILPLYNKNINPNKINLGNVGIDPNLTNLLSQLNNLSEKEKNDNENIPNCKIQRHKLFFKPWCGTQIKMPFILSSQ